MNQLLGGTHYLVVRSSEDRLEHLISAHETIDGALSSWGERARVSPIFPLNGGPNPKFSEPTTALFLGPIYPGLIVIPDEVYVYLTLGLYNVLAISSDETRIEALRALADSQEVHWEQWAIDKGKIENIQHCSLLHGAVSFGAAWKTPVTGSQRHLLAANSEYRCEVAEAVSRSQAYLPQVADDLIRFDRNVREELSSSANDVQKLGTLTLANAALSRHSSQTYSGVSPLFETECHIAQHSLLGIGTGSMAIWNIRRHVERVFSYYDLIKELASLRGREATAQALEAYDSSDPVWQEEYLFPKRPVGAPTAPVTLPISVDENILPLLTFFSPRDGFRSTTLSLSAPLEVLSACNTPSWTLMTLSHEMSHVLIDGVLGELMPDLNDETGVDQALSWVAKPETATSLFESVCAFLLFAFWQLTDEDEVEEEFDTRHFLDALGGVYSDAVEVLTHVFDFIYFYGEDQPKYVRAIWASWGVIPNIQSRIPSYVVRSLCALHTANLRRKDGLSVTIDQLLVELDKTQKAFPDALYIPDAIKDLTDRRDHYAQELHNRSYLVQFVMTFLRSAEVIGALHREIGVGVAPSTSLSFDTFRVGNPLHFIDESARDLSPDRMRSIWMVQHLGFTDTL